MLLAQAVELSSNAEMWNAIGVIGSLAVLGFTACVIFSDWPWPFKSS